MIGHESVLYYFPKVIIHKCTLTCLYQITSAEGKKQLFEAEVIYLMAKNIFFSLSLLLVNASV